MRQYQLCSIPLLLAALACDRATAPGVEGRQVPIAVAIAQPEAAPVPSVTLGATGFTIRGQIQTPTPCYNLTAYRADRGRDVTITIVATSSGGMCARVIATFEYTIETPGACGTHLVIVHHYAGTGWPDKRVFDESWNCINSL